MSDVALVDRLEDRLLAATPTLNLLDSADVRGVVTRVSDDVAWVAGLDRVGYEELVCFDSGALGMALDLGPSQTGVVLLTHGTNIATGDGVIGLHRLPWLPVGPGALGRTIDPLGAPLGGGPPLAGTSSSLFRPALEFIERKDVDQPLLTGVMVIDAAIPIGRGQRELIMTAALDRARAEIPAVIGKLDSGTTPEDNWVTSFKRFIEAGKASHETRTHPPSEA